MSRELRVRRGAVLFWRLGPIEFGPQERWSRAPESRGLWAFPWPYMDSFFTAHKYFDLLPKHLQTRRDRDRSEEVAPWAPAHPSGYVTPSGATPLQVEFSEDGDLLHGVEVRPAFQDEREEWVRTVGMKVLPLRKFWYEGELYSHIDRQGRIGNAGTLWGETDWYSLDAVAFAAAVRRARGVQGADRSGKPGMGLNYYRYSMDHMEVFIPPKRGFISGRVDR